MINNFLEISELINNFITPIGIIIGGLWAYRRFRVRNEGQWNANLIVNTETIKEGIDENLVHVHITIDNIGFKKITPTKSGLTVKLYKASTILPDFCIVDNWVEINEINNDILTLYKNDKEDYTKVYNLDSGAVYYERVILKIKDKGLYKLKCRLHIKDKKMPNNENCLTEYVYFQLL